MADGIVQDGQQKPAWLEYGITKPYPKRKTAEIYEVCVVCHYPRGTDGFDCGGPYEITTPNKQAPRIPVPAGWPSIPGFA